MSLRNWLLLLILSLLWGGSFFLVGIAVKEIPTFTLVLARLGVAAVVLVPLALALRQRFPASPAQWRDFAVMAVLNNVLPFSLFVYGQSLIASGLAAVLNAATPLMTLIVARLVAGDRMTANKTTGVVVGLIGVAVLIGPEAIAADRANATGMLACLAATVSYGCSAYWSRRLDLSQPIAASAAQLTCSSLIMLVIAAITERFWTLPVPAAPTLAIILVLGVVSTAIAYVIFFQIIATAGAQNAMLVTLLVPPSAIALGAFFLNEALSMHEIIGALIITSGLLLVDGRLVTWAMRRAQRRPLQG